MIKDDQLGIGEIFQEHYVKPYNELKEKYIHIFNGNINNVEEYTWNQACAEIGELHNKMSKDIEYMSNRMLSMRKDNSIRKVKEKVQSLIKENDVNKSKIEILENYINNREITRFVQEFSDLKLKAEEVEQYRNENQTLRKKLESSNNEAKDLNRRLQLKDEEMKDYIEKLQLEIKEAEEYASNQRLIRLEQEADNKSLDQFLKLKDEEIKQYVNRVTDLSQEIIKLSSNFDNIINVERENAKSLKEEIGRKDEYIRQLDDMKKGNDQIIKNQAREIEEKIYILRN